MKVLIVDDAAFMRLRLRRVLEQAGHTVQEAENGNQAVALYERDRPDAVFMDISMPECDGFEAMARLRAVDPAAQVIMLSALGQQETVIEAIQKGAVDFIVKPYEPERIQQALARILSPDA